MRDGLAVEAVGHAHMRIFQAGEHVQLGQRQLVNAVELDDMAQGHQVEPAHPSRAAGGRAVFVPGVGAAAAQSLGQAAAQLGDERPAADRRPPALRGATLGQDEPADAHRHQRAEEPGQAQEDPELDPGGDVDRVRREALARARATGQLTYIAVSLDDSISAKHKNTRHLAGVDWHFDHVESTPHRPRFKNGLCYLGCNVWLGGLGFTFAVQPYLREKTVRRLNRQRPPAQRIPFRSKLHLAQRMLTALQPLLPADVTVYVLHDSWYASARLLKFTHRQNWHTITALKFNRKLNHQRLDQHSWTLRHQRYAHVRVTATDGTPTSYCTRTLTGRLEDLPFDIRVIDSKRHPRAPRSAYFGCTDLSLETQQALQIYGHRWGCETDNVYLHTRLGLGDFRVRSYEAVDKWVAVVHLALVYAQWRLLHEPSPRLKCVADVIRQHCDEHLCDWLSGACQEALISGDLNAVLQRFLRLDV